MLALLLVALIVLGAGGTTAFILTRPAPVITLTGPQQSNALPAGSPDLALHVAGSDFTAQSAITFLLDGKAAPGAPEVSSDQHGAFAIDLPITDDWLFGQHTLTAKDAQGYVTKTGARLLVLAAPVISVTSSYAQGSVPAGANGTTLAYSGKRFALNSPIALQLNGKPLESAAPITSDERGRIAGTIPIDATFALGSYTLTAQYAQGDVTQTAASFVIVTQGEAGTPGPHGAPADDFSFGAYARISAKTTSGQSFSFTQILTITGNPDPAGGSVCSDQDNGQPQTFTGKLIGSSETFTKIETRMPQCFNRGMKGLLLSGLL